MNCAQPLTTSYRSKGFPHAFGKDVHGNRKEQRDFILTFNRKPNRLQELFDHLLDLSRLEQPCCHRIGTHTPFSPKIIVDVLPQFQVMTQKHTLSSHLPPNLPLSFVDAKRIAQFWGTCTANSSNTPDGTEITLTASAAKRNLYR